MTPHTHSQDATLAMIRAHDFGTFYSVSKVGDRQFHTNIVVADGFKPTWGMGTGFWDGLDMTESQLMNGECAGPNEDEC